jgi:hypothetical protein
MPMKETIARLEDVEEAFRSLYVAEDGQFVLDVDDVNTESPDALRHERKLRGAAESALKQLTRELGVTDPGKAIEGLQRFRELGKLGITDPVTWEAAVGKKAEEAVAEIRAKVTSLEGEGKRLREQLEDVQLDGALRTAATQASILPSAVDDVVASARRFWSMKDGTLIGQNGEEKLYSPADPTQPMSLDEWLDERQLDRAHWFSAKRPRKENGHPPGVVTLTRDQAKDPATYRAAKERAERTGGQLLIV